MCGKGAEKMLRLLLIGGLLVCYGLCQNAEPNKRIHDLRNERVPTDLESQRDCSWDVATEGVAPQAEEPSALASRESEDEQREALALRLQEGTRLESRGSVPGLSQSERRRKKRRRNKQQSWRDQPESERENLVNIGGRNRGKKKQQQVEASSLTISSSPSLKKGRSRIEKFREERRKRRRNRKRMRSRMRSDSRREERRWMDSSIAKLLKIVDEQEADEARFLSENPLNLSRLSDDSGVSRILNSSLSSSIPAQLTTEPRIPEPPKPTSRYSALPGEIEREFSRHVEHEFTRARLAAEKSLLDAEEDESEEQEEDEEETADEESPSFDERYSQRRPDDPAEAPFDPERMLGYSRTDEDLPILDMEKEVLQRTLKDYNAYMSSSAARATKTNSEQDSERARIEVSESSSSIPSSTESTFLTGEDDDNESQGDLSCMNGTFVPAPFVHHAVIKYVKSSKPGHEYLEADYECESGYSMQPKSSGRLLCRNRGWTGRLPLCKLRADDEATCAKLGCEQICRLVSGRAECLCREGYRLEARKCIDIDECLTNDGRGPCQDTCHNEPGGFSCSCEGRPGSRLGPDNRTCLEDEDEDDEAGLCSYNNAGCSHTCLASMGRVFCLCPDGFMLEDDWKTCQDVDECAVPDLQTEVCRYGCVNTPGSYRCSPPPERPLDPPRRAECQPGYEATTTRNCIDVNECATNNGGCSEVCENTEGSYFCACEGDERILTSDKKTCVVAEKRFESLESAALRLSRLSSVACSPLNPAGRGYLMCASSEPSSSAASTRDDEDEDDEADERRPKVDEKREPIRPGTKCSLRCPHGYELHGEYELTCRADGTWDGPKHGECLRYSKPRLDCPKDVVAELPPGHDEAFVTYEQPSTDLDWFRYVRSKPSWGTRLEANLKLGVHEISFYARHPVSKKQTSCTLRITIEEGQAPKVKGCPSDIEITGKNGSAITWVEPVFTDNVKVTRITSNQSPGQTFSTGGHKVEYEAADEAGWTTKCIFTVVLRPLAE